MEYEDIRLIVRLAVEVRELNKKYTSDESCLEKLDEIIKDARQLGGIHDGTC